MTLTTDPNHPDLKRGGDDVPVPQNKVYLVLSPEEISKGYVKPYRTAYRHAVCNTVTTMGHQLSATYARDPYFYGATYCVTCSKHRPLCEFAWLPDGEPMDPAEQSAWAARKIAESHAALAKKEMEGG